MLTPSERAEALANLTPRAAVDALRLTFTSEGAAAIIAGALQAGAATCIAEGGSTGIVVNPEAVAAEAGAIIVAFVRQAGVA